MRRIRNYQAGDIPAIVALYNAAAVAVGGDPSMTDEQIRMFMESPEVDPASAVFIVENDGQVIGYADYELNPATGSGYSDCAVHPDHCGQGIGTELIRLTEAYVLKRAQEVAPECPVSMERSASETNTAALRLLDAEGYEHNRSSYKMKMELDRPVDLPPLPDGITLRPFDVVQHGRMVYEVQQEVWRDHRGFEPASWEEWSHYVIENSEADPSLWLTAYEGDEMVGICVSRPYGATDPDMAYVRMLGVRRQWRKQGLGFALLKRAFALFQARGYKRVSLGVDAASLTNAVALYERAGMHIDQRSRGYRKMLRGEARE